MRTESTILACDQCGKQHDILPHEKGLPEGWLRLSVRGSHPEPDPEFDIPEDEEIPFVLLNLGADVCSKECAVGWLMAQMVGKVPDDPGEPLELGKTSTKPKNKKEAMKA